MGADHIFQAKSTSFFPFKSRVGVKIIEGTLVSISPIMWLGGTNVFSTKEKKKLPDTVMGRAPYATSFSRTCNAIFPEPLTTHLGKIQTNVSK